MIALLAVTWHMPEFLSLHHSCQLLIRLGLFAQLDLIPSKKATGLDCSKPVVQMRVN